MVKTLTRALAVAAATLLASPLAAAQEKPEDTSEAKPEESNSDLAKKLSNPISDLVSIPFQFNWNSGVGPTNGLQLVLNIQPVVPVSLTSNWNLIGRFILPIIAQPILVTGGEPTFGFGDVAFSLFLSPNKQSGFVWGIGPIFGLPMGTNPALGAGKWEAGPTAVALWLGGPWTIGMLVNQLWSFSDVSDMRRESVSQMFAQPFVAYTTENSFTFTAMTETTINWKATSGQKATVPVELLASKVTRLGPFPFSVQLGAGYFVETPTGGPDWRFRMNFVVLLPRKK